MPGASFPVCISQQTSSGKEKANHPQTYTQKQQFPYLPTQSAPICRREWSRRNENRQQSQQRYPEDAGRYGTDSHGNIGGSFRTPTMKQTVKPPNHQPHKKLEHGAETAHPEQGA
jgi:hypothetical protein